MTSPRNILNLAGVLVAALMLTSCASTPPPVAETTLPVWPSPPDEPRIGYVRSFTAPGDVGQSDSMFVRVGYWLTGENGESLALRKPCGVALDEDGNLCVTDTGAKTVCLLDFKNKKWRRYPAAGKTMFAMPVAVAKRNGIFYVADSGLGKVLAFSADGRLGFEVSNPLVRPSGLALSATQLAVADSQTHSVFVFDLTGKLLFSFGHRGTAEGEFNFPTHIAVDGQGRWLVTDSMNCRIQTFSVDGKFISQFGGNSDTPGHFARPKGVATDVAGRVYVTDALFNNFQIFDAESRLLLAVGTAGNASPGKFDLPAGVAISADNKIFVADSLNRRVQEFKYLGQP